MSAPPWDIIRSCWEKKYACFWEHSVLEINFAGNILMFPARQWCVGHLFLSWICFTMTLVNSNGIYSNGGSLIRTTCHTWTYGPTMSKSGIIYIAAVSIWNESGLDTEYTFTDSPELARWYVPISTRNTLGHWRYLQLAGICQINQSEKPGLLMVFSISKTSMIHQEEQSKKITSANNNIHDHVASRVFPCLLNRHVK